MHLSILYKSPTFFLGSNLKKKFCTFIPNHIQVMTTPTPSNSTFEAGDTAWVLASTALVWIMIPGVGFFYSGIARSKNALSLIMLSFLSIAIVSIQVKFLVAKTVLHWHLGQLRIGLGLPCFDYICRKCFNLIVKIDLLFYLLVSLLTIQQFQKIYQ